MKKNPLMTMLSVLIIAIVYHVVLFSINVTRDQVFWVLYGFTIAAILMQAVGVYITFITKKELKDKFLSLPLLYILFLLLIIQLFINGIGLWLEPSVNLIVIIEVIFFGFIGILVTTSFQGKQEIERLDQKILSKRAYLQTLQIELSKYKETIKDPQMIKELQKLIDALRYSDPMSHESLTAIEQQIHDEINNLTASDLKTDTVIKNQIENIIQLVKERNQKTKQMKQN